MFGFGRARANHERRLDDTYSGAFYPPHWPYPPLGSSSPQFPSSFDIVNAVREEVRPVNVKLSELSAKVDTLSADHVTRGDIEGLRREMRERDALVYPREVIDQMFRQRDDHITENGNDVREVKQAQASYGERLLTRFGVLLSIIYIAVQIAHTIKP